MDMEQKIKNLMADILLKAYVECTKIAMNNSQTVGVKNDFYVTLEQLEAILMSYKN